MTVTDEMVNRFLAWPLPASVNCDPCATQPNYPHDRVGTNLLTAIEARQMLEHVLATASPESNQTLAKAMGDWTAEDIAELRRMIPNLNEVLSHNPLSQVAFRAGLLACREYMARFVEQGGSDIEKKIGQSIRANWWPSLGEDPGPPRRLRYDEIADEKPDGGIDHKDMSPSVEALPRAIAFLGPPASGMSLRDYLAAAAMTGLARSYAEGTVDDYLPEFVAQDAYKLADAMLEARKAQQVQR